jgi:alpha-mannosidase
MRSRGPRQIKTIPLNRSNEGFTMKSNRVGLRRCGIRASAMLAVAALLGAAPKPATRPATPIDLTTGQTLYAVGYAHLDTQWRWAYPMVIRQFLGNTLHANFPLIEKYPDYIFNFTGARRYQFMKEYFPADYARMKGYIQAGRWFPGGSNVDETDQNVPCAESVVRQVLYGNHYFRQEFGVCGTDFMVPDCFGFPASLPSVLAHCSIKGFSTQKLSWGSAVGIPFNVGVWQGIDGQGVLAALNPTAYTSRVTDDMSHDPTWIARLDDDVKRTGVGVDYRYYGTGDRGGAPAEASILNMEKSVHGGGPVRVVSATSDQMFRDITPAQRAKLPVYKGELLLTWHSTGSITSQGYMKRWNRKNELLADAAERASVAASWLGATPYPTRKLYDSWMLLLECQMHDILPGDCLPKCYEYSWNDEVLASNGFAAAETDGVGGVAAAMDTRSSAGVPLDVYNPLSIERHHTFEATVHFPGGAPASVAVTGPDGKVVPSQVLGKVGTDGLKILVLATVPSVSFTTFDVRPSTEAESKTSPLSVSPTALENARYAVTINADGDVAQVLDKANGNRPLLSGPIRLGFLHENPTQYPAWNMDWEDRQKACQEYVGGPATVRVVENGPVRVAVEITRHARGSTFVQRVQLTAGGDRVEFPTHIDWRSTECSLEAVMPMATSNPLARYDVAVGTIERPNNNAKKYEVPQQQWLDLTNPDNSYGVSVLNDCKYGSDKPDDHTIRLTLLYTPGVRGGFQDEGSQDFGKHDMTYALTGHAGDWRAGHTRDQAAEINQPLVAFQATPHAGPLGKSFSLVSTDNPGLTVQAIKKAEDGDEIIVRVKETDDRPIEGAHLKFAAPVVSAREVDGQEAPLGPATVDDGKLRVDLSPYHLRAYAVRLAPPAAPVAATVSTPVQLPLDADVVSTEQAPADGAFGPTGRTYPAEQWPRELVSEGITFHLGDGADGQKNAVVCHGQTVRLPAGAQRAYVLAAADGDRPTQFKVGDRATNLTVQDWGGYIGQWDARLWKGQVSDLTYNWANRLDGLKPGYIKRDSVAWHADHQHDPHDGNEIYQYCYLFKYGFDVPAGATTLTLPDDDHVRVFAVTGATAPHDGAEPARPLYDTLADHVADQPPAIEVDPGHAGATGGEPYHDTVWVHLDHPLYYQDGSLRYTTDGTDPNAASSAYTGPFPLSAKATVTAREFDRDGHAGPAATRVIDVRDTTPPTVVSADGIGSQRHVRVAFSEPVALSSAQDVANYQFDPPLAVRSATLVSDAQGVDLALADGPAVPSRSYRLTVRSIADASPAANVMSATTVTVDLSAPVFTLAEYAAVPTTGPDAAADARGLAQAVPNLPVKATAPWTITCFVRPGAKPDEAVLIAGFGKVGQDGDPEGVGRYLCEFPEGLRYWGRNRDLQSDRPLDANRWQMLSATYDGRTVTLYRNGEPIARGDRALADDEATVRLAPPDPWTGHRFRGELRDFTVWNVPLSERSLQMLWDGRRRD